MKLLKTCVAVAVVIVVAFALVACGDKKGAGEVNVYMWSDYMSQSVVDKFTEETGIKVNFSSMSTSEEAVAKLSGGGGGEYDLVMPCDADMTSLIEGGHLAKINKDNIPNYENLGEAYKNRSFDPDNEYAVPYFTNYVYVVYNKDTCNVKIEEYKDLLDPQLKGQISSVTGVRNLFPIALVALGYDPNSRDTGEIEKAYEWMKEFVPNVKGFDSDSAEKLLINGACSVGFFFDGQASRAYEEMGDKLVIPDFKDAIQLGVDEFVIPKDAKNKENAEKFLNFFLDAENMADNMKDGNYYSCPNDAAVALMPDDYKSNPTLNLPEKMKKNHFLQLDVGDAIKTYDKYWTMLMSDVE